MRKKIERRIEKLKQLYFRSGGITVDFDEIVEMLKIVRFNRIKFWENLLKDFINNNDFYLSKIKQKRNNSHSKTIN